MTSDRDAAGGRELRYTPRRPGRYGPLPVPMTGRNATTPRLLLGLLLGTPAAALVASLLGAALMVLGLAFAPDGFLPEAPAEEGGGNLAALLLVAMIALLFTVPGAALLAVAILIRWLLWRDVPAGLFAVIGFFAGYALWPGLALLEAVQVPVDMPPGPATLADPGLARGLLLACWFSGPAGAVAAWAGAAIARGRISG